MKVDRPVSQREFMSAIIVDKKEKQKQIIEAAVRVFAQKGFVRSTIYDIAREAGIGKGTIYEYFESKEDVINLTFETFMEELVPDFGAITQSSLSATEKLCRMISGFAGMLKSKEKQDLLDIMFDLWAEGIRSQDSRGSLESKINQFYQEYRKTVAAVLEQGIQSGEFRKDMNTRIEASILVGLLDGILVQWILDKKRFPVADAVGAAVQTIIYGIQSRAERKNQFRLEET
jgi:TetR/AcrR family transcriptional regulator, fatty acid metabolism regulator protein